MSEGSGPGWGARTWTYRRFWGVALAVLALDQATKRWIFFHSGLVHGDYPPEGGVVLIPGFFNIVFTTNTGAAWGLLADRAWWLLALALVALLLLFLFRRTLEIHRPTLQPCFGLLVGGIAGNLWDRLEHGRVIDFLDFILWKYRWPTFNIADSAIFLGVFGYLLWTWRESPENPPAVPGGSAPEDPERLA